MTFTPIYASSFDTGNYDLVQSTDVYPDTTVIPIQTTQKKTGTSALKIEGYGFSSGSQGGYINRKICGITTQSASATYDDLYFSFWCLCPPGPATTDTNRNRLAFRLYLDDLSSYYSVNVYRGCLYIFAPGGAEVAGPSDLRYFPWWSWALWEVHMVSAVSGSIQIKINGNLLIDYSGNTTGGTNHWAAVRWVASGYSISEYGIDDSTHAWYLDNIVSGTGGWPGDIRVDSIVPNSDVSISGWTQSTGGNIYSVLDEIPGSETDYAYATETSKSMELGHAAWDDLTGTKIPIGMQVRARIDRGPNAPEVEIQIDNGVANSKSSLLQQTGAVWREEFFDTDAAGTEWNTSKINNTNFGVAT